MKKITLSLLLALSAGCIFAQAGSQRLVVLEEFTSANCPPCAGANPGYEALCAANLTKAVTINYQEKRQGVNAFNAQTATDMLIRDPYYGYSGNPALYFDGGAIPNNPCSGQNQHPTCMTQTSINNGSAIVSPFTIELLWSRNTANTQVTVQVKVTCTQAKTMGAPKLHVVMIEDIALATAPGSNGEKNFPNSMRKMYPDANGATISTAWTVGQSQTYDYPNLAIPSYIYDKNKIAFVAFIQDNTGKGILQGAYAPTATTGTGINNVTVTNSFDVYPNPSNGAFTTSFNATEADNYNVKITNTLGQVIFAETLNNFVGDYSKEMNISAYGKGIYLLSISNSQGEDVKKVITY